MSGHDRTSGLDESRWPRTGLLIGDSRGRKPLPTRDLIGPLLIPLMVLLLAGVVWAVSHIEDDIESAAPEILTAAGIDASDLSFEASYRNLEVSGKLPAGVTPSDVIEVLEARTGGSEGEDIRSVAVTASIRPAEPLGEIDVQATADGDTIVLTGIVPSDGQRNRLVDASVSSGLSVIDNLTVSGLEAASPDPDGQTSALAEALATLAGAEGADLRVGDAGPVRGTVQAVDATSAATILAAAGPSVSVSSPTVLGSLGVAVTYDGTRIVLTGDVLTTEQSEALSDGAADAVRAGNVVNNLTILNLDPLVEGADERVDVLAGILRTFGNLLRADAAMNDTDLTVNGETDDPASERTTAAALNRATRAGLRPGGEVRVVQTGPTEAEEVVLLQVELDGLAPEIGETVVFSSESTEITAEARATLDKVADAMSRYLLPVVEIGGHTDSGGDESYNLDLSERRADVVRTHLVDAGVDPNRLRSVGFGEAEPRADNDTVEGRLENRRVEFIAMVTER
ncbi:MAG: OmpA family protein [Acidimicrobiales bacterium]